MWIHWLVANCAFFQNNALEMAPDGAAGEGLAGEYFGRIQNSRPGRTIDINVVGFGVGTLVGS